MILQSKAIKLLISLIFILSFASVVASAAPFAYITNYDSNNVSVIDTSTNLITDTVTVGTNPYSVAVNPAGTHVYVANRGSADVSVIDTLTNTVTDTVTVETNPCGVAVNPAGTLVYVSNSGSNSVSVIDTSNNTVTDTVTVGSSPFGVAVNPAGTLVYVANYGSNSVSVIDTSNNTVTDTVTVGTNPVAFGIFISPGGASDTTEPGITISTPQEGESYDTSTIALNVTADESIVTWQYSINGTANVTFTPNITLSSLPNGNHNVTVYANDSAGNIGSAMVNFSIDATAPFAYITNYDSNSGGRGGLDSSDEPENVEETVFLRIYLRSGDSSTYNFNNVVTSVEVTPARTYGLVSAKIEVLFGQPGSITSNPPAGVLYKYVNVFVGTSRWSKDKLSSSVINFQVPASWFVENNIDPATVTLYRHYDDEWQPLTTTMAGQAGEYYQYSSPTPGLSTFVIQGQVEESIGREPAAATDSGTVADSTPTPTPTPGFGILVGIMGLLIAVYSRKK